MDVLRHWTIYQCPQCWRVGIEPHGIVQCGCEGAVERIEVVEARPSTDQGAVSADLCTALEASESYPDDDQGRGDALMALQSAVRHTLDHQAGAVSADLTPDTAAVAATLVDLMKRSLPPHISEAQQVEAYLALNRIARGAV